jgi:transcriptional regulator with XRE-family HTH domain
MTTGERIKKARLELGMTQEELGEKVGVQKAAINKYETGIVVNLKRGVIVKLADVLNVTPEYLMGWDEDQGFYDDIAKRNAGTNEEDEVMKYAEELRNRPGMRLLFDATKNCTEEDMRKVADMIKALRGDD